MDDGTDGRSSVKGSAQMRLAELIMLFEEVIAMAQRLEGYMGS